MTRPVGHDGMKPHKRLTHAKSSPKNRPAVMAPSTAWAEPAVRRLLEPPIARPAHMQLHSGSMPRDPICPWAH